MTATAAVRPKERVRVKRGDVMYGFVVPDGAEPFVMWWRYGQPVASTSVEVTPQALMLALKRPYNHPIPTAVYVNHLSTAAAMSARFKSQRIPVKFEAFPKTHYPSARHYLQRVFIEKVLPPGLESFDVDDTIGYVLDLARAPWSPGEVRLRFEREGVTWGSACLVKAAQERTVVLQWTAPDGPQRVVIRFALGTFGTLTTVLPRLELLRPLTLSDMEGFLGGMHNVLGSATFGHQEEADEVDDLDEDIRIMDEEAARESDTDTIVVEYMSELDCPEDQVLRFEASLLGSEAMCTVEVLPYLTVGDLQDAIRKAFNWEHDQSLTRAPNGKGWPQLEFWDCYRLDISQAASHCHFLGSVKLKLKDRLEYILGAGRREHVHDIRFVGTTVQEPGVVYPRALDVRGLKTRPRQFSGDC